MPLGLAADRLKRLRRVPRTQDEDGGQSEYRRKDGEQEIPGSVSTLTAGSHADQEGNAQIESHATYDDQIHAPIAGPKGKAQVESHTTYADQFHAPMVAGWRVAGDAAATGEVDAGIA